MRMGSDAFTVAPLEGETAADALRVDMFLRAVDDVLGTMKDGPHRPSQKLLDAMTRALRSSGAQPRALAPPSFEGRIHALLVLEAAGACSASSFDDIAPLASPAALAVELAVAHCRLHDELPAMVAPARRRGHAHAGADADVDEATAILAGDALLADAFGLLSSAPLRTADQVKELSLATGSCSIDLAGIERRRSARLIATSAVLGGLAVDADDDQVHALRSYGEALGAALRVGVTQSLAFEARERAVRHARKLGRLGAPLIALARRATATNAAT